MVFAGNALLLQLAKYAILLCHYISTEDGTIFATLSDTCSRLPSHDNDPRHATCHRLSGARAQWFSVQDRPGRDQAGDGDVF